MFRVTANEGKYFDMFVETTDIVCKAARMLNEFMNNYENVQENIDAIEKVEHECDQQVHSILDKVHSSFITPIDREDIDMIAKQLDNITDSIESAAHRFRMYNVKEVKEDALKLGALIVQATDELRNTMIEFKNLKKSTKINEKIVEINRIENEGDVIYRGAITKLFVIEDNPLEVIKWKEIYEYLEQTLDACEDVANIVEGVVMKHA